MKFSPRCGLLLLALAIILPSLLVAQTRILDTFDDPSGWKAIAAEGVRIDISPAPGRDGQCLKIDFDFVLGAGYCGIQKQLPMTLPENFQFTFHLRGEAPVNNLEFKLIDASGDNVWWRNQRSFEFPHEWTKIAIKKRHIDFAWGPTTDRTLRGFDKIEIFIASATGGKGTIYLDDLTFQELRPPTDRLPTPVVSASTRADANHDAGAVMDANSLTQWRSAKTTAPQALVFDLGTSCEIGGLVIDWDKDDFARQYNILLSADSTSWETVYAVTNGKPGRSYIYLRDQQTRYLELELRASARGQGYAIAEVVFQKPDFSETPETFFSHIARDYPRGSLPKYFRNEQSYWTVVGANNDPKEALINEEGMIEVDKSGFSIEPFLFFNGRLIDWNDVKTSQSLEKDYLPIPTVTWQHDDVRLQITAFVAGAADSSVLLATYRLQNLTNRSLPGHLYLAIRPFQVNPPTQWLNWPGGTTKIKTIRREGQTIVVNENKRILLISPGAGFGAAEFDAGDITDFLARDRLPAGTDIRDHFGYASGALRYNVNLPAGAAKTVAVAVPFHAHMSIPLPTTPDAVTQTRQAVARFWDDKISTTEFKLPPAAAKLADILRSNLAYILINRDRAGIQPGSRSYERSWIRDGALTSAALLRFGIKKEVRDFLDWYAPFQFPSGKIPCVVDSRGADPVPENDSHGEFIYAVLQYFYFTGDTLWLREKFPYVGKTVEYIESLRDQRKTDDYQHGTPEQRACYGLLPESISHEGYSAKPMHSYWDDFFGLKGLQDATTIAGILGESAREAEFAAAHDDFRNCLYASMQQAIANQGIDFIPGCVELGDFDATSTTIGLDPGGELAHIPQPQLDNTFDRYFQFFEQRRDGKIDWVAYTPYETRIIGAFVLLGQKERAHALLDFFLQDQRPQGWNHWAEVVGHDPKAPRFIGDMPHTWVGSDFIRSLRNMLVYERENDRSLVVGAGILPDWVMDPVGVAVQRLPTYFGTLNFEMKMEGNKLNIDLDGDLTLPPGKIIVQSPIAGAITSMTINGKVGKPGDRGEVVVAEFPARIVLEYVPR